jgi:ABC-type nitrate/sulfonate/bicarbonate transport system substrate-binding protein
VVTCSSAIRLWLSVLYVLLVLCPLSSHAQEKRALKVVFTGLAWNSELPFRVALARGFFKAQGLEIQPIFVRGGPMALAALSSGEVDFPRSVAHRRSCAAGRVAWTS